MEEPQLPTIDELYKSEVFDNEAHKIGPVGQVYLSDATGEPSWVTVKTGFLGTRENFVPLAFATFTPGKIQLAYSAEFVKNAPAIDPDFQLSPDEETDLLAYYTDTELVTFVDDDQIRTKETPRKVVDVFLTPENT